MTNHHIKKKKIKLNDKRKFFKNQEMDYTCIEIRKSDDIKKFFKIDPILFTMIKILLIIKIYLFYNILNVMSYLFLFHMEKYYH